MKPDKDAGPTLGADPRVRGFPKREIAPIRDSDRHKLRTLVVPGGWNQISEIEALIGAVLIVAISIAVESLLLAREGIIFLREQVSRVRQTRRKEPVEEPVLVSAPALVPVKEKSVEKEELTETIIDE